MGTLYLNYKRVPVEDPDGQRSLNSLSKEEFVQFNSEILGLGDLKKDGTLVQVVVAVFDLGGFTEFCSQSDPHLTIPEFMRNYLEWLFSSISNKFKRDEDEERVRIWGGLPFFAKFMGDGVLFLWDKQYIGGQPGIGNIITKLIEMCYAYTNEFRPTISRKIANPPSLLRCGVAQGQIISIGDNRDFVGPCINLASRLQKLVPVTFAAAHKGIDLDLAFSEEVKRYLLVKKVDIRGIGREELVMIQKSEYDSLPGDKQKLFREPAE